MAKRRPNRPTGEIKLELGDLYEKQWKFIESRTRYTAYGGARGGGKTHVLIRAAIRGSLQYPGIKILILRRTYPELEQTIIQPMNKLINSATMDGRPCGDIIASYNGTMRMLFFSNGSTVKFGHLQSAAAITEYQGQEYDWIFMDEATHFCVHPDTEVLLERGWANITEVRPGDKVLSLNPDGSQAYKPVDAMYAFPYDGPMCFCDQRKGVSFCVTPNHKIPVVSQGRAGGWRFVTAESIKDNKVYRVGRPDSEAEQTWMEINVRHRKGHNEASRVPMDDWIEFMGWYLSEGSSFMAHKDRSPVVHIAQVKDVPSLSALMARLPWRASKVDNGYRIYSGQLYSVVHKMGDLYHKRVPEYVFGLSARQISILLRAFEAGDGHIYRNGSISIGLANEGLIDDLQRLYTLSGRCAIKSVSITKTGFTVYRLSVSRPDRDTTRITGKLKRVPYKGLVWCPSVRDNHNFLIRYNGKLSFTGNTEYEFRTMGATLRGVNDIPKHFYLTCNPGGVGHQWVKRLFVTREYEGVEDGKDYSFIPATVEDNTALMKSSPEYIQMLDTLPDDIRAAHRYGDWDAMAGQYFSEFRKELHVCRPFVTIPAEWPKYRAFDYGLDMFACYWFAIDFDDRVWVYREYCESGLIVSQAAEAMRRLTPPGEQIQFTVAPPDMWSTQKDSGRTMAEIFMENGIGIVRASSQRIQGWMVVKEFLKLRADGKPGILFTTDCPRIIRDLPALQHDEKNPSDVAKEPHDITHSPDAIRYGLIYRTMGARLEPVKPEPDEDTVEEYDDYMTGGDATDGYLSYGG